MAALIFGGCITGSLSVLESGSDVDVTTTLEPLRSLDVVSARVQHVQAAKNTGNAQIHLKLRSGNCPGLEMPLPRHATSPWRRSKCKKGLGSALHIQMFGDLAGSGTVARSGDSLPLPYVLTSSENDLPELGQEVFHLQPIFRPGSLKKNEELFKHILSQGSCKGPCFMSSSEIGPQMHLQRPHKRHMKASSRENSRMRCNRRGS